MNDTELQDALETLLDELSNMDADDREQFDMPDELTEIKRTITFSAAGVMTDNCGLVIETADGSEFQLTIVQSR